MKIRVDMNDKKVIAFVPIRHESQRLPGKNYRLLGDKPLYYYMISTLLNIEEICCVIIDTNSPIVIEGCNDYFKEYLKEKLIVMERNPELTDPMISMNMLIESFLVKRKDFVDCIIFQTHVTNPFLKDSTIISAIKQYRQVLSEGTYDSLFSVSTCRTRFYDSNKMPINHDPNNLVQTQDLSPIYEDNSCIYLFTKESFEKKKNRLGESPYLYLMHDKEELVDIDWLTDFELAEAYLERRKKLETKDMSTKDMSTKDMPTKDMPTKGKAVLITGVSGGIGRATAFLFKKEGYYVYGTDKVDFCGYDECDKFIKIDLCDEKALFEIFKEFSKENKKLDALINIAASQSCMPFENVSTDSWNELMTCNLKSPYFLIQTFLPLLKEAKGSIVNISSIHSFQTSADISAYAISKAGFSGLTRSLAIELGKFGIRVNGICPGAIDTPMLRDGLMRSPGDPLYKMEKLAEKHIMGYIGKPEDIANAILFLADNEKARFITGTHLVVDGGATIKLSTE